MLWHSGRALLKGSLPYIMPSIVQIKHRLIVHQHSDKLYVTDFCVQLNKLQHVYIYCDFCSWFAAKVT
jgi:hypothetical protein